LHQLCVSVSLYQVITTLSTGAKESKALMDLLVELCSCYHLNPALHTLELLSPEGHPLGFKPNALLGSLNVACVLIKEKVWEEKVVRRPAPKVPEKTVRLVVNYHRNQKAVVRVNPLVPLQTLLPVICDKCEFDPAHVLLLKDSISRHELPLDKSLTQLEIKELYVLDQSLGKTLQHAKNTFIKDFSLFNGTNIVRVIGLVPICATRILICTLLMIMFFGLKCPTAAMYFIYIVDLITCHLFTGPSICHQANGEVQNKNNNACTAGGSSESSSANTQQPSQSVQHRKSLESMNERVKDQRQTNTLKEEKQMASALKSNVDVQKKRENTQLKPGLMKSNTLNYQEKKHSLSPNDQRSAPTKEEEIPVYRIHQNDTSTTTSHSKITHNSTSRFGMKTFTVVPPKPSVTHAVTVKPAVTVTTGAIKIDEQGNMVKLGMSRNKFGGSSESNINCKDGSPLLGKAKAFWSSNERQESALAHSRDPTERTKENTDGLKHTYTTIDKPPLPPTLLQDQKRDLSFLKPSRRTSSQYVASAISKSTPKTLACPSSIPNIPESSSSLKTQNFTFQKEGRSIHVNPHQFSHSSLSNDKEISSGSLSHPPGPKRSMSYPEYMPDRHRDPEELKQDRGEIVSCLREKSSTGPLPALAKKPEPSVIVSDDTVLPEPQQVTVFGPVKKFRPVICKSVQKDTCLHSSLMEAIQTGGGKDRLRKISGCGPSSLKKPSYVEEENERSSLLAAIRDRSNSGRLRKVKYHLGYLLNISTQFTQIFIMEDCTVIESST
uniref:WH2 domain-containing protein n=1 Tax=Myripristis murdjan TaxID=586833 RepID=A0A668APF8_9TELE